MPRHLLVTNDFPPKVGGIQAYLWELWRRLPPEQAVVYCTPYDGAITFDAQQDFRVERSPEPVLLPYPWLAERIRRFADEVEADFIVLDPAVPLGLIGPALGRPYGVILHGAEVTIPGRLPGSKQLLARVLDKAALVISAGDYALAEAERCVGRELRSVVVPPGVDTQRFQPLPDDARQRARQHFGIEPHDVVIATVNRLVPRKGMHLLIEAVAELAKRRKNVRLLIGGSGREAQRLASLVEKSGAPVRMLGRISDDDVALLYGAADMMAMMCHDRWRGLEQEGFGIVFLEAAAAGLPQIAGRSGGADEAVEHGVTGLVVEEPTEKASVVTALTTLVDDATLRRQMGQAARMRAVRAFEYDLLATRLLDSLDATVHHIEKGAS